MANAKTTAAVKRTIESVGSCLVPQATIEWVLGTAFADDDEFEASVNGWVDALDWITSCEMDFILRRVLLRGPQIEVDN